MFGVKKKYLLKHLENLRRRVCCYATPEICDCKYGIPWRDLEKEPIQEGERRVADFMFQHQNFTGLGEQTGCPELRQAIELISSIPDLLFPVMMRDAGILEHEEVRQALEDHFNKDVDVKDTALDPRNLGPMERIKELEELVSVLDKDRTELSYLVARIRREAESVKKEGGGLSPDFLLDLIDNWESKQHEKDPTKKPYVKFSDRIR